MTSPYEAYLKRMIERMNADLQRLQVQLGSGNSGRRRRRLEALKSELSAYENELNSYRKGLQVLRREEAKPLLQGQAESGGHQK